MSPSTVLLAIFGALMGLAGFGLGLHRDDSTQMTFGTMAMILCVYGLGVYRGERNKEER